MAICFRSFRGPIDRVGNVANGFRMRTVYGRNVGLRAWRASLNRRRAPLFSGYVGLTGRSKLQGCSHLTGRNSGLHSTGVRGVARKDGILRDRVHVPHYRSMPRADSIRRRQGLVLATRNERNLRFVRHMGYAVFHEIQRVRRSQDRRILPTQILVRDHRVAICLYHVRFSFIIERNRRLVPSYFRHSNFVLISIAHFYHGRSLVQAGRNHGSHNVNLHASRRRVCFHLQAPTDFYGFPTDQYAVLVHTVTQDFLRVHLARTLRGRQVHSFRMVAFGVLRVHFMFWVELFLPASGPLPSQSSIPPCRQPLAIYTDRAQVRPGYTGRDGLPPCSVSTAE